MTKKKQLEEHKTMIPDIQLFNVAPNIPDKIRFLETLSCNMWWSWNYDAIELFRRISPQLWRQVGGNSRLFLSMVPQERLKELAEDRSFISHLKRVKYFFEKHESGLTEMTPENLERRKIAYFSLEYGIHESVRLYSGGLGILAGSSNRPSKSLATCAAWPDEPRGSTRQWLRCRHAHAKRARRYQT